MPVASRRSKRAVYSSTAASPRARTPARISDTAFCTALSVASLNASNAASLALKSGAAASSRVMVRSFMLEGSQKEARSQDYSHDAVHQELGHAVFS